MKNLSIILLSVFSIIGLSAQAQTKKRIKKTATTAKTTPAKTVQKAAEPVKTEEKATAKSTNQVAKQSNNNAGVTSYKAAIGLKFIYGVSLTGKFFISEKSALEGILRYNSAGGLGSNIAFSGLYEYHEPIKGVDGLRWYIGGGGHVNYFSYKDSNEDAITTFGVAGIVGLEYKFGKLPLAISADWQPGYIISNNMGFSAENGGIGLKYTF